MGSNKVTIDGNGNFVIQGSDNITINQNNPEEIRNFLIAWSDKLNQLPEKILNSMKEKASKDFTAGANVYLSVNCKYSDSIQTIIGMSIGVTITNLTKENRFFNQPFFKVSPPFEKGADTFLLVADYSQLKFPKKLEYGEVLSQYYKMPDIKFLEDLINKDSKATIQAFTSTTLGEVYESNIYQISKLIEMYNSIPH